MTAPTIVQRLAELSVTTRTEGLPGDLRQDVAHRILDLVGNCLAAVQEEPGRAVMNVIRDWGGPERATAIGSSVRVPASSAALLNGTLAHSLDFDDTHLPSVLHPSSPVIPAALAVGQAKGASGPLLLDSVGVGIEVAVRLGLGGYDQELGNSEFFERGQHATSICGAVGAAVAAATVAGLDEIRIAHAAGIAASMGAGLIEANRTGGTVKRIHCGWAAHAGVVAAEFAASGITGPPTVIEGRFGFLHAFCGDRADVDSVVAGLGEVWELSRVFFKPYPCNHFTHAGIDAARTLIGSGIRPEDIADIELGLPSAVIRTIGEPHEEKIRPRSGYHAAFSGPYTVAAAILGGGGLGVFHEDFTDVAAADPARLALAAKVRCVTDARCNEIFPHQFPAVLTITTKDGRTSQARVDVNRGGGDNPLSSEEIRLKFMLNAQRSLTEPRAHQVAEAILGLPGAADLRPLAEAIQR